MVHVACIRQGSVVSKQVIYTTLQRGKYNGLGLDSVLTYKYLEGASIL